MKLTDEQLEAAFVAYNPQYEASSAATKAWIQLSVGRAVDAVLGFVVPGDDEGAALVASLRARIDQCGELESQIAMAQRELGEERSQVALLQEALTETRAERDRAERRVEEVHEMLGERERAAADLLDEDLGTPEDYAALDSEADANARTLEMERELDDVRAAATRCGWDGQQPLDAFVAGLATDPLGRAYAPTLQADALAWRSLKASLAGIVGQWREEAARFALEEGPSDHAGALVMVADQIEYALAAAREGKIVVHDGARADADLVVGLHLKLGDPGTVYRPKCPVCGEYEPCAEHPKDAAGAALAPTEPAPAKCAEAVVERSPSQALERRVWLVERLARALAAHVDEASDATGASLSDSEIDIRRAVKALDAMAEEG